jgi:hypothetical protein
VPFLSHPSLFHLPNHISWRELFIKYFNTQNSAIFHTCSWLCSPVLTLLVSPFVDYLMWLIILDIELNNWLLVNDEP